mmetsp:Transcript_117335/g.204323  ORF Transcript_117335/g.204323 Transcript_117335/m.204323 type:complete len:285 (-) Transcript_117335:183-1037(-)
MTAGQPPQLVPVRMRDLLEPFEGPFSTLLRCPTAQRSTSFVAPVSVSAAASPVPAGVLPLGPACLPVGRGPTSVQPASNGSCKSQVRPEAFQVLYGCFATPEFAHLPCTVCEPTGCPSHSAPGPRLSPLPQGAALLRHTGLSASPASVPLFAVARLQIGPSPARLQTAFAIHEDGPSALRLPLGYTSTRMKARSGMIPPSGRAALTHFAPPCIPQAWLAVQSSLLPMLPSLRPGYWQGYQCPLFAERAATGMPPAQQARHPAACGGTQSAAVAPRLTIPLAVTA